MQTLKKLGRNLFTLRRYGACADLPAQLLSVCDDVCCPDVFSCSCPPNTEWPHMHAGGRHLSSPQCRVHIALISTWEPRLGTLLGCGDTVACPQSSVHGVPIPRHSGRLCHSTHGPSQTFAGLGRGRQAVPNERAARVTRRGYQVGVLRRLGCSGSDYERTLTAEIGKCQSVDKVRSSNDTFGPVSRSVLPDKSPLAT
jgi:hypothetical protein